MGIRIDVDIDIAAPPERVFELLTRRDEVARWSGVDCEYLPGDGSDLHAGYRGRGHMQTPDGSREIEFEVTSYDPPALYAYRDTYAGGDQTSTYTLTPGGPGTHLELSSDTDYARMALPRQATDAMASLPEATRAMVESQMQAMQQQISAGGFDENPAVRSAMESATRASLEKLKQIAEAG